MHNGSIASLTGVIEHYSSGIKENPNLSPQLRNENGSPKKLELGRKDKLALVAFLKTLTDRAITSDEKFSDPFK